MELIMVVIVMKYKLEPRKISRKDFYNLNEDNLMFITNPGRMGDEDGSTFVIKKNDNYIPYRVDGWMDPNRGGKDSDDYISLEDMSNVFPKWRETWHNYSKTKKQNGKYIYIYMGFGNGLCVDKRIYEKYNSYLMDEIKKSGDVIDENGEYDYSLNFRLWDKALIKMIDDDMNNSKKRIYRD